MHRELNSKYVDTNNLCSCMNYAPGMTEAPPTSPPHSPPRQSHSRAHDRRYHNICLPATSSDNLDCSSPGNLEGKIVAMVSVNPDAVHKQIHTFLPTALVCTTTVYNLIRVTQ